MKILVHSVRFVVQVQLDEFEGVALDAFQGATMPEEVEAVVSRVKAHALKLDGELPGNFWFCQKDPPSITEHSKQGIIRIIVFNPYEIEWVLQNSHRAEGGDFAGSHGNVVNSVTILSSLPERNVENDPLLHLVHSFPHQVSV